MAEFPAASFRIDGDPGAIRGSAASYGSFGSQATAAAGQIRSLDTSLFIGPEGDQYRAGLKESLPPHLDVTGEAYSLVATALNTFAGALSGLQDRMAPLAVQAPGLWQDLQTAQGGLATAKADDAAHAQQRQAEQQALKPGQQLPADTYTAQSGAASAALSSAQQAWNDCLTAAGKVKADLQTAIDACCSAIHKASGMRFKKNPSGFGAFLSSVGGWVKDHVADLAKLSSVLKTISFVSGMLSFIPVIGEAAMVVSVVSGGLALGIDAATMAATGKWSTSTLLVDGLALVPVAGKLGVLAGTTKIVRTAEDGSEVLVKSENLLVRTRVSIASAGDRFSQVLPRGTRIHVGPGGTSRVLGDAPQIKDPFRSSSPSAYNGVRVSRSLEQNRVAARSVARFEKAGASDVRVDQAQVDSAVNKVGTNRPDVQATVGQQRVHFEYDRPRLDGSPGARVAGHVQNILRNDPNSVVVTVPSGPPT